ncbi:MAG TPA: endolytic transglycosylase MltG, partial [Thermoleophilaceae bacterium]|nr:endolytic transglycosylase MltG [Thermoleophilaceae bacterium]
EPAPPVFREPEPPTDPELTAVPEPPEAEPVPEQEFRESVEPALPPGPEPDLAPEAEASPQRPARPQAPPPLPPDLDRGTRRPQLPPFPPSRPGGDKAPGGRRRARVIVPLGVAVLLVAGLGWFLASLFQPFAGEGDGSVGVIVPRGASVQDIGQLLERRGVVPSAFFFRARASLSGRGGDFKAGNFNLREGMSYGAAMDALSASPGEQTVQVTIPEGRSRREVDKLIGSQVKGDYLSATRSSRLLKPREYRARNARSLEGFLFPATYELKRGQTVKDLVSQQVGTFKREFRKVELAFARRKNLTPYDVLVIASMVDREAQVAKERPLIASVIYNRLRQGIPLGIDATIRFATNNWTEPLKQSELDIPSAYNTRAQAGLPPGPIGSPGLDAIKAAARPARTKFIYFVVKPNTCGEHAFSVTDAQFQRDSDRYDSERTRRGGKSPTNC